MERCCPDGCSGRGKETRWSGRVILSVCGHAPARDHLCACLRDARACAGKVGGPRGDDRQPALSGCQTDFAVKTSALSGPRRVTPGGSASGLRGPKRIDQRHETLYPPKMTNVRPQPFGRCARCDKRTFDVAALKQRCGERYDGKRCKGTYQATATVGDWVECSVCHGSGVSGEGRCGACDASGWAYSRMAR